MAMATALRDLDPVWRAWLGTWCDQFNDDLPVVFYANDDTEAPDEWATSQVAGLHIQLQDADWRIDRALDRGSRREFMVWAKRRASLAARLQNLLISVATREGSGAHE